MLSVHRLFAHSVGAQHRGVPTALWDGTSACVLFSKLLRLCQEFHSLSKIPSIENEVALFVGKTRDGLTVRFLRGDIEHCRRAYLGRLPSRVFREDANQW